jgi:hypothetical protein
MAFGNEDEDGVVVRDGIARVLVDAKARTA